MLAHMPSPPANSSPGYYWYGNNNLPDPLDGPSADGQNQRPMRRTSEGITQAAGFESQETSEWNGSQAPPLHIDTSSATLVIRPQPDAASASASALQKAPLAPKQGGALANARGVHVSPIAGTYALRTPRGKITSIACESCRKRKSKCDGVRPKCNTCQSKSLTCVYDVAEDGKTTTQLRAHVRRLAKDLDDMKSIVSLLAVAPNRTSAADWALEIEKNGFTNHSVEEIKKALSNSSASAAALSDREGFGTPTSDHFVNAARNIEASPYAGSSRDDSREHSQPDPRYHPERVVSNITRMNPPPLSLEARSDAISKFGLDCAYYQRTKRELFTNGWSEEQIFGRYEIDVDALLFGLSNPDESQAVSTWCSQTVNKILPATALPVRLASAYLLTKMMRYLIWPTIENMNASPDWLMPPVNKQESSPDDILIDLVPWPGVRQLLYQHPQDYPVDALIGLIGMTWPYADDACHYWDVEGEYTRMTPLFESAVAELNNWTIDPKILEIIPQLEGHIPVKRVS